MSQRPDYVENFDKPPKTEIKKISGHWYLYSYKVVYDEIKKKKVKKSGDSLGVITPEGLVPSKKYTPVAIGLYPRPISHEAPYCQGYLFLLLEK